MDQRLVQRTRYLLQARFKRIRTAQLGNFSVIGKQTISWLDNHPLIGSIIAHLKTIEGDHHSEIERMVSAKNIGGQRYFDLTVKRNPRQESEPEFVGYTPSTIEQHASACLGILREAISDPDLSLYSLLAVYLTQESYDHISRPQGDAFDVIKEIAARDVYEFVDEQLDGYIAVNALLKKYKQLVEWFKQEELREIEKNGFAGKKGERALAVHLQQYIFNQSVEFFVEATSTSGEADLLLRDSSGGYAIMDAKFIKAGSSDGEIRRKIAEGFNQVSRYCSDYNQPVGFLAVFVNENISILLDVEQFGAYRFLRIGGNLVYYIEINISERPSASRAGRAKQIHISPSQIIP